MKLNREPHLPLRAQGDSPVISPDVGLESPTYMTSLNREKSFSSVEEGGYQYNF
jgi:hypothetical protein